MLEEAGAVDAIVDRILEALLRRAGEVVDSLARRLDRKELEELVREAVERKVDNLLRSRPAVPNDPDWLRDLVRDVVTYFGDYTVSLPGGRVERPLYVLSPIRVRSAEVELPDIDSLADLAVKAVRPRHEQHVSFLKRPPVLHDYVGRYRGSVGLSVGDSAVAEAGFRTGRRGVEAEVKLWVPGLVALGLAEKVKPGTAGEILRKVGEALRKGIRSLVTTELFISMLREQYMREGSGG
jgi:hypothetical protein